MEEVLGKEDSGGLKERDGGNAERRAEGGEREENK